MIASKMGTGTTQSVVKATLGALRQRKNTNETSLSPVTWGQVGKSIEYNIFVITW